MCDLSKSEDALFEALTITREFKSPSSPLYYCGGHMFGNWGTRKGKHDIVYYNKEKQLHRIYGPAYISENYNIEGWYKDGELHRVDGPAYKHKNNEYWFYEGELHRLDGPAVNSPGLPKQYWIHGQRLSPKEYKKEIERRKRKGLIK